ncbi:MAG TPA: A/G-specific adenine glycosylase [Algoriphagus sp.]|jgi:A/G-specific adenine glycosylase|uniref:A/G-specific adenine glycosylase n=1 Tax=unclassified Algoriphagus TaxID=2641541 RepID=UPI000C37493F|nr:MULTISPECIES: A/G-specific adenine glycosylase [unclassified Algoriphagus]MAL14802.1 A/G-specific adenine glycosylase [Algoriphagus sp.]HAD50206.1 A/G-specific adenine glycosylase [Algoriphagus sp.]HAH37648.1 A/G-specific adenine glycosylase [Algoriphagus sp.]HCB46418.1 A/G-specific adenine glycosylase [Algoriphagus sp.]HCD89084.1 A/G-specific adenine glycosylase [Algoriphagus sp.]|tara:strand:+ start:417 stop:1487 length:1071 start_codon:yes stop_codon:yes gene_type:complete
MNTKATDNQLFSHQILSWYRANPRELPWRGIQDPYKIWLSEIILQQTRVAQGMPYYFKFTEAYPTVKDLALAPEEEVLRLWQGLGYYSRARNLHSCAKYVWHELNGNFPETYKELLLLKGVGSYTASAIASFAFGEVKAVVDGNVFRVLARYFGIETDIASGKGKKQFEALADQLIPADHPGEFNQAMMDFGARHCTPANPSCDTCPLSSSCFALNNKMVKDLPVKINKIKIKERHLHYYVIRCGEKWVWKKRSSGDIWEGLFDFPHVEQTKENSESEFNLPEAAKTPVKFPKNYRHILSHQKLNAVFSEVEFPEEKIAHLNEWAENNGFLLVEEEKIEYLAKPKLIVNFLNDQGF